MLININSNNFKHIMAGNNDPKSPLPGDSNDPNYEPNPEHPITVPKVDDPGASPEELDE